MNHRRYQPSIFGGWYFFTKITIKSENSIKRIYRKVGVNYRTQLYKA